MITPAIDNPSGTLRKHSGTKTFVLDPKSCEIRTYSRSRMTNEVSLAKTERFQSLSAAEWKFKLKK